MKWLSGKRLSKSEKSIFVNVYVIILHDVSSEDILTAFLTIFFKKKVEIRGILNHRIKLSEKCLNG